MRLSEYTDYSLRVLMYCAAHPGRLVTIGELAEHHQVSKNHLMKVVNDLSRQGVIETTRGRGGGLRLLQSADQIRVGDIVRVSETDFRLVECFDPATNTCTLTPSCRLKQVFSNALQAYFRELDGVTLADLVPPPASATAPAGRAARTRDAAPVRVALPKRRAA
ncbi:MAG TPA: Rrf2 family transcriptional regulator [Burkholderiaceae bacterium]|nr:Rrf2 family transcriptional regulator [Burkholderiaceae bacterium]HQZ05035.1 Rrf2 family transcriptional regulator [Burkholderiaceae bacterium]